jgi:hypothetical protein
MNYEIIKDEKLLRDFIDWLPDTTMSEQYYLCLFARSKYCKDITHIKSDKSQLKRFTSTKDRMFDKIKQLECEVGSYKQYKKGETAIPIPQEALALYITPNPRDLWRATLATAKKMLDCIEATNITANPQAEAMSEIQKSRGVRHMVDFDIDFDSAHSPEQHEVFVKEVQEDVSKVINLEAVDFIRTRGGLHILVKVKEIAPEFKSTWHQKIAGLANVDQTGDMMVPVVGCTQGNFIPHFINLNNESPRIENVTITDSHTEVPKNILSGQSSLS